MTKKKRKKNNKFRPIIFIISSIILLFCLLGYLSLFKDNTNKGIKTSKLLYINIETSSKIIAERLLNEEFIENKLKFRFAALLKRFNQNIRPGRYELRNGMSNSRIINMFIAGNESPTQITFNNIRTKQELAARLGQQLLIDSVDIIGVLNNNTLLEKNQLNVQTVPSIFIPDTYEVYWTISAEDLLNRMIRESDKFWTESRLQKAKKLGLKPSEVVTLASIVEEEIMIATEKPIVAGLYINRLKKGYLLQADPTLKFALNDFAKKRVLNEDKKVESPYNTYKYKGLPPGPIRIPEKSSIDAVLNYKEHNYLYMCARDDRSGYHHFSRTLREHNIYASSYRKSLDKRKIFE